MRRNRNPTVQICSKPQNSAYAGFCASAGNHSARGVGAASGDMLIRIAAELVVWPSRSMTSLGGGSGHRSHHTAEVAQVVKVQLLLPDCRAGSEKRCAVMAFGVERYRLGVGEQQRGLAVPDVLRRCSGITGRTWGGTVTVRLDSPRLGRAARYLCSPVGHRPCRSRTVEASAATSAPGQGEHLTAAQPAPPGEQDGQP